MGLRAREERLLRSLNGKIRRRKVAVFDFECKNDDTQGKGWTRPTLVGFDDGEAFLHYRNDEDLDRDSKVSWERRHLVEKRGLVDRLMRTIFAVGSFDPKEIRKYQSRRYNLFSHNGGRFDDMLILSWLREHEAEYMFEIAAVQSRIQRLDVWPVGEDKRKGHWSFFDSVSLLPLSLAQMGKTFCPEDAQKLDFDLDLHEHTTEIAIKPESSALGKNAAYLDVLVQALVRGGEWFYCRNKQWWRKVQVVEFGEVRDNYERALVGDEGLKDGDFLYVQGLPGDVRRQLGPSIGPMLDAWVKYNALDCKTNRVAVERFHDLVERLGGEVGITAPATAMKLFRRVFLDDAQPIVRSAHFAECKGKCERKDHRTGKCNRLSCDGTCHGCAHDFVRRGYYGGRTEMFRERGKKLRYQDLNSSYPASMLEDMPVGRMVHGPKNTPIEQLRNISNTHIGFVECEVEIPEGCAIPPLPYKVEEGRTIWFKRPDGTEEAVPPGKLIFPTGTFRGVWDWEELKLLDHPLVQGKITWIGESAWYQKRPVFREMVLVLYRYRQKHLDGCGCPDRKEGQCNPDYDEGLAFVAKLLLNSLYGKFGMREERTALILIPTDFWANPEYDDVRKHGWPIDGEHEETNGCRIWEVEHVASAAYIVPQISAHITALSRIRLFHGVMDIFSRGGVVYYLDSVTGDRCVPVRDPQGRTHVMPIEELWERSGVGAFEREDGKETCELPGWTTLARDLSGKEGWFPIDSVVRHRTLKNVHLISTKEGQTEVTSDHGIVVGSPCAGEHPLADPQDFLRRGLEFQRVFSQPPKAGKRVDLFDHVKDANLTIQRGKIKYKGIPSTTSFEVDADGERFRRVGAHVHGSEVPVQRFYDARSPELHALLRTVGAFVAEGSASLHGALSPITARGFTPKYSSRHMFSISQDDPKWLEDIAKDLRVVAPGVPLSGPFPTSGCHVLRYGGVLMPFLYAALCGEGHSRNRRLPQFCLDLEREDFLVLWKKLMEGDGYETGKKGGYAQSYCTQSLVLASQLSFLLSRHGFAHGVAYRPDKKVWTLRTRSEAPRKGRVTKYEVRKTGADEYVYDLSVPGAHTFVDACGGVLVHNTDSILSDIMLSKELMDDSRLGAWKLENPKHLIEGHFVLPKLYKLLAHEMLCPQEDCAGCSLAYHLPTCKDSKKCEKKNDGVGCAISKQIMKGVGGTAKTAENFASILRGETIRFERVHQHKTMLKSTWPTIRAMKDDRPLGGEDERAKKSLRSSYDKRQLRADGTTVPIHILPIKEDAAAA